MILVEFGGQQFVGFAPVGKSALTHLLRSGAETGAAKADGTEEEERLVVVTP